MLFNTNVPLPVDLMKVTSTYVAEVEDISQNIENAIGEAKKELEEAQQRQKKYYNGQHKEVTFDIGEKVQLSSKHLMLPGSQKINQHWLGPFVIQKHNGDIAYELSFPTTFAGVHPVFHVSLLQQYNANGGDGCDVGVRRGPVQIGEEEQYEVERIVAERGIGPQKRFHVRWKGWDASEDYWMSANDLKNAPDVLQSWLSSN